MNLLHHKMEDNLIFQAIDWYDHDFEDEYLIKIFGRTPEGKSVCLTTGFQPYFFIKLPPSCNTNVKQLQLYNKIAEYTEVRSHFIVKKKDLMGFQNNEKRSFMLLKFDTKEDCRKCQNYIKYQLVNYPLYEANIDPKLRFMHRTKVESTGWIQVPKSSCLKASNSYCDLDYICSNWLDIKPVEKEEVAPFRVGSFDIECYSTGGFPNPENDEHVVYQIAVTTKIWGQEGYYDKTCLCLKQTTGENIECFETEKDLLMGFCKLMRRLDHDVITGWNIYGFDLRYIYQRCVECGVMQALELSRIKEYYCSIKKITLTSSALGKNDMNLLPMPGRFVFDLFHDVKREKKLESYSLNFVSKTYLGDQKLDMTPKEIFRRYEEGTSEELGEVAKYCIKDTELPHEIMDKLKTLPNLLEMAKATWVPLNFLTERGQQIKVFSLLTRKARDMGYMVPTIKQDRDKIPESSYQGATVLEPEVGAYYKPITALDFASLYPSIMVAHNMCYSSLVMDPKYDNLPGVEYEDFDVGNNTYRFAQNVPSLLPTILTELKEFRKMAKKDMARTRGTPMEAVFNGKQLAYKISMNSVYGFTGVTYGMLPCVAIASSVTKQGRNMIDITKEYVEKNFKGAKVRYGDTDSVMVEFDVGEREGKDAIEYSWKLGEQAANECTTLFKSPNDLELEKVYCPFFLYSKKRYGAKMWTEHKGEIIMEKIDVKGLQLVRRDLCPYARKVCKEVLDMILESSDPSGVKKYAKDRAIQLLGGEVPMEDLTLTKSLGDNYKNPNQQHVAVVNKMRERNPGSEPQKGDRVPYVIINNGGVKAFEKSEDPKYVVENNLKIDYNYYFMHQLLKPVSDLLKPLVGNDPYDVFGNILPQKMRRVASHDIRDLFARYNN